MALRATLFAALVLGSSISAVSAADAPAPLAVAAEDDAGLPRFEPAPAEFAEAFKAMGDAATEAATTDAVVIEDAAHDIAGGVASWYGREFAGHRTASGERFDPAEYTAAHRTLPFGSKVRVTRNGHSVVVRINDRGPFARGRVIDLSQAAANELGLVRAGSGQVTLALLDS